MVIPGILTIDGLRAAPGKASFDSKKLGDPTKYYAVIPLTEAALWTMLGFVHNFLAGLISFSRAKCNFFV